MREIAAICGDEQVPFLDHLSPPVLSDADYTDGDHLSRDGARKYTRWLVEEAIIPAARWD